MLLAWFDEGEFTPSFREFVNKVIRQKGSIADVIDDLIQISALMSHMIASTLGIPAQSLIQDLAKIDLLPPSTTVEPDDAARP